MTIRRPPRRPSGRSAHPDGPSPDSPGPPPRPPEDPRRPVAREAVARRGAGRPEGLPPARLRRYEYRLTVPGGFAIEDDAAPARGIARGEHGEAPLFIAGESCALVRAPDAARAALTVEVHDAPPDAEDPHEWDHVAEFPLAVPSGRLTIRSDAVGPASTLRVLPGPHRVRLCIGGLAGVGEVGGRAVGGFVRYKLALWPRDTAAAVVLKRWAGAASPGQDGPHGGEGGGPDADLDRRVAWALDAGDVDGFVARVFDPIRGTLRELEEVLDALAGEPRVDAERRHALAAELDHIKFALLEQWELGLLDGGDADAG